MLSVSLSRNPTTNSAGLFFSSNPVSRFFSPSTKFAARLNPNFTRIRSSSTLREKKQKSPYTAEDDEPRGREGSESAMAASVPFFPPIKAAKRVVLVRHGQSTWNAEGRIQAAPTSRFLPPGRVSGRDFSSDAYRRCLRRFLLQTPNSPIAIGSTGGRKTKQRIILVCHRSLQKNEEVQEVVDCLGADCVPRYVEMKEIKELDVVNIFQHVEKWTGRVLSMLMKGALV